MSEERERVRRDSGKEWEIIKKVKSIYFQNDFFSGETVYGVSIGEIVAKQCKHPLVGAHLQTNSFT